MNKSRVAHKLVGSFLGIALVSVLIGSAIPLSARPSSSDPAAPSEPASQNDDNAVNNDSDDTESGEGTSEPAVNQPLYTVLEVIDGDTIDINYEGAKTRIRLIGIDTPETKNPEKPVECYGPEASAFLTNLLSGKQVSIEADATQDDIDIYGRPLRYVYLDGQDVGLMMLAGGYAHEYTFNTPYQKQSAYKAAENDAKTKQLGLWAPGVCPDEGSTNQPATPTPTPAPEKQPTQTECLIKGNINKKGEKIYHLPGQQYYDETIITPSKGERYFCTEAEAQSAGWRKAKV